MAMVHLLRFVLIAMVCLQRSMACSNFAMQNSFGISVRTMDLGDIVGLSWTILAVPAKDSKHGFLGFAATLAGIPNDNWLFAGINDAGLSCDAQTLLGTEYPNISFDAPDALDALHLCRWALESFGNLHDLEVGLQRSKFTRPKGPEAFFGGLHWVLRDAHQGIVVEFLDGQLKTYRDPNDGESGFGIMTNEPSYQWHLQAVKHLQWKESLARTAVSMPGSWYPDERFQRIFLVKRGMPKPTDYQEAMMQAVHVLNTVTVPMGLQLGTDSGKHSGEGTSDHTQWGVIYDHVNRLVYWRHSRNQNLQRLDLQKLLALGQRKSLKVDAELPWFNDATDALQPQDETQVI